MSHIDISKKIMSMIDDEKELSKLESKFKIDTNLLELGYPPIIQSPSQDYLLK